MPKYAGVFGGRSSPLRLSPHFFRVLHRQRLSPPTILHVSSTSTTATSQPAYTNLQLSKLKPEVVDDLENLLEQRFFRYCDLSVTLHYLAHMVVRAGLFKMRLRVYVPSRSPNVPPQPQAEKDAAFAISLNILEIDNEGHLSVGQVKLKSFMWHVREFFQLETFVYTLLELRIRTTSP
jgi:hypothetical protein